MCQTPDRDDDGHEVAEIILSEGRDRRRGQVEQLEHYQRLSIHVLGWTLAFWAIVVSQQDPPTRSPWLFVAAILGVLSVPAAACVVIPQDWDGGPDIETMVKGYYKKKPRSDLEHDIIESLKQPYLNNKARLGKALFAVRAQSAVSLLSVVALILALFL